MDKEDKFVKLNELNPDWFVHRKNKVLFKKLCKLKEEGIALDFLLAKEKGVSGEDLSMLAVATNHISLDFYPKYLQALKLRYLRRRIHELSELDSKLDLKELKKLIEDAEKRNISSEIFSVKKDLKGYMDFFEDRMAGRIKTFSLGIKEIDDFIGKLWQGFLITIGARTSAGKTSLLLNFVFYLATHKSKVLFITSDMSKYQLVDRMISLRSGVDSYRVQNEKLDSEELRDVLKSAQEISCLKLFIWETATFDEIKIKELVRNEGYDVVCIDYFQRFKLPSKYDSRASAFSDIINSIKSLAVERKLLILVASQLKRGVDDRADGKVYLGDLKETGGLEEASDLVFLLEPAIKSDGSTIESHYTQKLNIKIAKHKQGPTGELAFAFDKKLCEFKKF